MSRKKNIPVFFKPGSVENMDPKWIMTDVFGSYTGLTESPDEIPVQDADDL